MRLGLREARTKGTMAVWAAAHAINDGYPTLYLPLLPVLILRWHFGAGRAGLLAGLLAITTEALQPVMGAWSDRRGGPWFIAGGLFIGSLGLAGGLAWAPSYSLFALTLLAGGLGNAAFHPHMAALVSQEAGSKKGRWVSTWMVSGMIGHMVAPLAAVAVWYRWGPAGMAGLAIPGILAAGALYVSARTLPRPPTGARGATVQAWRAAWSRGKRFGILIVFRNLGAASLLVLLPLVWHQRGGSPGATGALLATVYATGVIGNLLGGRLSDRHGIRPILAGSLVGAALAAAVGGWATTGTGWAFWVAVAVWGFAVNGAASVLLVYGQSLFPDHLGLGSGLTLGVGNTVGALGAWGVGAIAQGYGLNVGVDVAAACLLLGAVPLLGWSPERTLERS